MTLVEVILRNTYTNWKCDTSVGLDAGNLRPTGGTATPLVDHMGGGRG